MTTPMSLQPWWWEIVILIQLWSQFFQMFVYGDVSSHLHARTAYVVVIWPSFLFDSFVKSWATWKIFLGKWFTAPPLAKNFPYAYAYNEAAIELAAAVFGKRSGAPNGNFRENICSEDHLRTTIFGTFVVKFSCLPASPRIFEHLQNGIITILNGYLP